MDDAKTDKDKDTVKVLMQVKSGDQTGFVAVFPEKAEGLVTKANPRHSMLD